MAQIVAGSGGGRRDFVFLWRPEPGARAGSVMISEPDTALSPTYVRGAVFCGFQMVSDFRLFFWRCFFCANLPAGRGEAGLQAGNLHRANLGRIRAFHFRGKNGNSPHEFMSFLHRLDLKATAKALISNVSGYMGPGVMK